MLRYIFALLALTVLTGCSAVDISKYRSNTPKLDLYEYFIGQVTGFGIVQDRKGILTRQFIVDITGTIETDGSLKLHEKFDWSDGEKSTRTWIVSKKGEHLYSGEAEDVVSLAEGRVYGNVLNWNYHLNLAVDDTTWKIKFDDWMFLVTDQVLINKARMSKFGFTVGEVTIVFQRQPG